MRSNKSEKAFAVMLFLGLHPRFARRLEPGPHIGSILPRQVIPPIGFRTAPFPPGELVGVFLCIHPGQ